MARNRAALAAFVLATSCATTTTSTTTSTSASSPLIGRWQARLDGASCRYDVEVIALDVGEINYVSDDSAEKACSIARLKLVVDGDVMAFGDGVATCRFRIEDADHMRIACEDHGRPPPASALSSHDRKDSLLLTRVPVVEKHGLAAFEGTWDAPAFWGAGVLVVDADGTIRHAARDPAAAAAIGRVAVDAAAGDGDGDGDDSIRLTIAGNTERCTYRALDDKLTITCPGRSGLREMPLVFMRHRDRA